jgi:MFS family permease
MEQKVVKVTDNDKIKSAKKVVKSDLNNKKNLATHGFWERQKLIREERKKSKEPKIVKEPDATLKRSLFDGSFYALMDAFTHNFISPFALALKAGNTFISIITTLPALIASFGQLLVPKLLRIYPKRKFWILSSAFLQGLIWLPIAFLPYYAGSFDLSILFLLITMIAFFSAIINPLWSSLMGDIVPAETRGSYFGRRNLIMGGISFISTFTAGILLNALSKSINIYTAFGLMFVIAFASRMISVYYISGMHEPELKLSKKDDFTLLEFIGRLKKSDYGKYVIYLCLIGFAVNIASPFYPVYMLKDLNFTYFQFTLVTIASVVSGFITVFFWGRFADRIGNKNILLISGLLISFAPVVWFFTTDIKFLILAEMFSGIVWAGFNLSAANYIYDTTSPEKRPRCIVYLNVLRGSSIFFGAFLGSFLSKYLPSLWFVSAIPLLFIISAALRLIITLFFFNRLREARLVELSLNHSSSFISKLIINPRQAFSYNHSMKISEPYYETNDSLTCVKPKKREDPLKPMKKEEIKNDRFFLNQYFRVTKNKMLPLDKKELRTTIKDKAKKVNSEQYKKE